MKKYITIAALLAAGTAFANAETYTAQTPEKNNQGSYYGFCMSFDNTTYLETDVPAGVELNLDSITLLSRSDGSAADMKVAVYKHTGDYTTGEFLGLSTTTVTFAANTTFTLEFDNITVNSSDKYQFLYVNADATAEEVKTFDGYKSEAITWGTSVTNSFPSQIPSGWGTYKSKEIDSWEGKYLPVTTVTLSTIPEPSAFGLLAGIGALALVASRRRRK